MEAEKQVEIPGTVTGFGFGQINNPTPMWATWIFRTVFVLTTALSIWLASTKLMKPDAVVEAMLILKIVDLIVWGFGRFLGVKKADFEQ